MELEKNLYSAQIVKGDYVTKKLFDFEILYLFAHSSHTGYNLRKALYREFGNKVSFGTVYPHLKSLCEQGLIRSGEDRSAAKNYSLIPDLSD